MVRFILYIVLTYIVFFILKFIVNIFRTFKKPPQSKSNINQTPEKPKETIDKSKVVDADFEEIK